VLPQFPNLLTYAHVLLYRNLESGTHAADGSAIADAWSVLHFAQRMHLRGLTRIEDIIASEMAQQACERLRPLLKTSGRADEAASVALEQERWNVAVERLRSRNRSWSSSIVGGSLQWAGLTIHIAAFTAIGLLAASLLAFGFFSGTTGSTNASYGRFSTFLSVMADVAPPIALLACVTLFAVYHPYARTYESYFRANAPSLTAESMEELSAAAAVPYMMPAAVEMQSEKFTYLAWLSVTVVLSTFAALPMFRMWWHRRAA
jgi:hypothetical protein